MYSQNFDLIVTIKGDSIACNIDSITAVDLHYEMKFRNNWIHTQINKSQVREYKLSAISKETAKFKSGTSYLDSRIQLETNKSMNKNSIYVENLVIFPSINYDRFLSLSSHAGIILKVGLSYYAAPFFIAESSFLIGNERSHFEVGGGFGGKYMLGPFGRLGYRFIGRKGLVIKGGILIVKNVPVFPSFGIGYSF